MFHITQCYEYLELLYNALKKCKIPEVFDTVRLAQKIENQSGICKNLSRFDCVNVRN